MPSTRALIAAALVAGIPAGLIYAFATLTLASPVLFQLEAIELGGQVNQGWGRALWTVIGSVGLAVGLALLLVPAVRACGPPTLRRGFAISGFAFVAMVLVPGLFMAPVPPGVEHTASVATRQAAWLAAGAAFCLLYLLGAAALGRLKHTALGKTISTITVIGGLTLLVTLYWQGGLINSHGEHGLPSELVTGFQHVAGLANGALFLALALSVPTALKRLQP
jgi:predicted cobalt transporter CbtA